MFQADQKKNAVSIDMMTQRFFLCFAVADAGVWICADQTPA